MWGIWWLKYFLQNGHWSRDWEGGGQGNRLSKSKALSFLKIPKKRCTECARCNLSIFQALSYKKRRTLRSRNAILKHCTLSLIDRQSTLNSNSSYFGMIWVFSSFWTLNSPGFKFEFKRGWYIKYTWIWSRRQPRQSYYLHGGLHAPLLFTFAVNTLVRPPHIHTDIHIWKPVINFIQYMDRVITFTEQIYWGVSYISIF